MKTRLNLTIDDELLRKMKYYAQKQHTSVSELVEEYFTNVTKKTSTKNIFELVDELEPPKIKLKRDLKDQYFKDKGKKYGL